ncbi:hypothetical protein [Peribacillus simplex]|uniref:hypothetical protein n=1 Tax=Peribacillus simplex TaxID=1478 RepID=UPI001A915A9E|nr:hypothetical protein [Peribacillus simplex]
MKIEEACSSCNIEVCFRKLEGTIKRALSQTALQERGDLEQELYIKVFEKTKNLNFKEEAPSFWELLKKNF